MEYRIEQLAQASGVAVDTIRFYQGKGILEPPVRRGRVTWYGEGHLARLRRVRDLQQRGFTLTVIRRFLDGELEASDEALVAAVTGPPAPGELTLDELAARSGVAAPLLRSLEQAGLLVAVQDGDEPRYPADDLEALAAGLRVIEAGIPIPELIELARDHAAADDRTAARAVRLFDRHVRERIQSGGAGAQEAERELLKLFDDLLGAAGTLVRHHFQRAVIRAAREHIERAPGP